MQCTTCEQEVQTSAIHSIQQGQGIGCACVARMQLWVGRYDEFVALCTPKGIRVLTTREAWKTECTGKKYKPTLQCIKCEQEVQTTNICSIQQGQGLGCACYNKTEAKLFAWARAHRELLPDPRHMNELSVKNRETGGTMHFDISDETVKIILELDGDTPGSHFDDSETRSECPKRDLKKERWALRNGWSVIRLLQKDVWRDSKGWEAFAIGRIARAKELRAAGEPPEVFVPDRKEYTSGIYAHLRAA